MMLVTYLQALLIMLTLGFATWLYSLKRHDVSIVDSLWSLMFLTAAIIFFWQSPETTIRSVIILVLVAVWSLRLSVHLTVRNWGQPEDRRYQEIRKNNEPNFELKSLYIIFGLQAGLAWIISIPLLSAIYTRVDFHWLDTVAIALWLLGMTFESVADWQLLRFKRNSMNQNKVLDCGLWRYCRHPNYFGEFCLWWGFYLLAVPAGGWWTIYAPLLMSFLLLKVSGVVMTEKGMTERRPDYQTYVEQTNAFFPGRPKSQPNLISKGTVS